MDIENEIEQEELKAPQETKKAASGSKSDKVSPVKGFKKVVSGDFLMDGIIQKNIAFIFYITFLMILYVAYGYYANNTLRQLAKEEKRAEELYSKLQSKLEVFDKESLQSKIAERVKQVKLVESKDPPRVIWVNKKEGQ